MLFRRQPVEATRTGDALVAAFHKSDPPLIWHFDLARNHSFALELQDEDRGCKLGITSSEDAFHAIALFPSRAEAEKALAVLEKVIARGKTTWFTPIGRLLAALLLIILAIMVSYGIAVGWQVFKQLPPSVSVNPSSASSPGAAPPSFKNGVPEPADQFLHPPP